MGQLKGNKHQQQLCLVLLAGIIAGMALSTFLHQLSWQPDHTSTGAFAAGGQDLKVKVRVKGAGAAAGEALTATAAATKAQDQQQQQQPKQQQKQQVQQQQQAQQEAKQVVQQAAAQQPVPQQSQGRMHQIPKRMVVATGANDGYYHGLTNFVGSVHYWCAECPIIIFNLGLSEVQKKTVDTWCNVTLKWRDGIKIKGIDSGHVATPKQYAWKPFAILETVDEYKTDAVLWLDAGSTVTGPLMTTVWPLIRDDGHFLVQGQDLDMTRLCMQETFDYLKQKREDFKNKPSYAGNTVGFVYGSEAYHKILLPWTKCAAVPQCIAPPGSSTGNHRFDQVVLSIIAYTAGVNVTEHTELLEANRLPCFVPNKRVVWTSRTGESCYTKYTLCSKGYQKEQQQPAT